jgi:ectonucleotide pyrophosphatase/phosphodiesterase family protein 5
MTHSHGHHTHSKSHLHLLVDDDVQTNDPTLFFNLPSEKQQRSTRRFILLSLGLFACLLLIVTACIFTAVFTYAFLKPYIGNISDAKYQLLETTVFVISIDGFRHDFIKTYAANCPTLLRLKENGLLVQQLKPVFPTTLFPNIWSAVTGKYPEHHGILGNTMYDRVTKQTFTKNTNDPKWWDSAEPIWVTGTKFNFSSAMQYIPGSNAVPSTYYEKEFKDDYDYKGRFERLLEILDEDLKRDAQNRNSLFSDPVSIGNTLMAKIFGTGTSSEEPEKPHDIKNETVHHDVRLYMEYISTLDIEVHNYGPVHAAVGTIIQQFDDSLKYFLEELERREIYPLEDVNIVVMSTYGASSLNHDCHTHISELLLPEERAHFKFNNMGGYVDATALNDTSALYISVVYDKLKEQSKSFNYTVYTKDELPERFHLLQAAENYPDRTPDLWILMDLHCSLATSFYEANNGDHGYDNTYSDMSGMLVASGPRVAKPDHELHELDVVDVYPFLAGLLRMKDHSLLPHIDGSFEAVRDLIVTDEQDTNSH